MQNCRLSEGKAEYIWGAVKLIVDGRLNLEASKAQEDPDSIIFELDAITGIGDSTAELTMLRGMQEMLCQLTILV
jgi:3-methyladenine DNA glycosylase/8-oxoguanine DNA glycosylase